MKPLVSIICLCYNHEKFVNEALNSIVSQTYQNIEVLVVDDFSTDGSKEIIKKFILKHPQVKFFENEKNIGNCKSFNRVFYQSEGKYIIDFATDDVMEIDRVQKQVEALENLGEAYGVIFTNAMNIDENGKEMSLHYKNNEKVPSGEVYKNVLEKYFINPPTMMIRRKVLEDLGGYDESLDYEDFDFWVRSSRNYKYFYLNEVLTKRRVSTSSHSSKFNRKGFSKMAESTFRVVQKAQWLNRSEEENKGLIHRVKYEMRHCFYMEQFDLVKKYIQLLKDMNSGGLVSKTIHLLSNLKIPVFPFYKVYLKLRK